MRKTFFWLCLWLAFAWRVSAADTLSLTLTDGSTVSGEIVKSEDTGVLLHIGEDSYTNILWSHFSQDSLKQLSQDPKLAGFVGPFIDPADTRTAESGMTINKVTRLDRPAHPSVLAGLFTSSVGLFVLFVLYMANLYAAFEIALVRNRPLFQVLGVAAILPIIGPAIFVWLPMVINPGHEELPIEDGAPVEKVDDRPLAPGEVRADPRKNTGRTDITADEIQVLAAADKQEKKVEPQIYARGKFTFNKRFVETKFAGFIGELKGDGKKFTMLLKTSKEQFVVEHIAQTGQSEIIFETMRGQITVPYADIQEIKLNPILA